MHGSGAPRRLLVVLVALLSMPASPAPLQAPASHRGRGNSETLDFGIEWRLVRAGEAKLTSRRGGEGWQTELNLEAAGMVAKLFEVNDDYATQADAQFCTSSTFLRAQEGARSRETKVTFDHGKSSYIEKDLVKNSVQTKEMDVPVCVYDLVNELYHLRASRLEP